jgi:polysaccharide biosynthesis protein PslA
MRPRRLVTVRANRGRRRSSHGFRTVDLCSLALVTVVICERAERASLLGTPVGDVVPFVTAALVFAWALRSFRLYRFVRSEGVVRHFTRLVAAWFFAVLALLVTYRLGSDAPITACWQWSVLAGATLAGLHAVWWSMVRAWRAAGWLTPNVVIVGATDQAERIISDAISRGHVNVVGVFDDRLERNPQAVLGVPVLGNVDALLNHRIIPYLDRVVIVIEPVTTDRAREIATRLAVLPNDVTMILGPDDSRRSAALARLEDLPLAELRGGTDVDRRAYYKRLQDLAIAGPALILLSPLLVAIAVSIKMDSRGPVFFRQRRHGFNHEEIVVWKFRSMRADQGAREVRQVTVDDERVTRVGRYLRRTSLDELPQLINVLRGEMSLVGPRPHAIGMKTGDVESAAMVSDYAHRHRVKPGITGWAAINGSRGPLHTPAEVHRRVALDIDYIARQSFGLDLQIMAMTLPRLVGDHQTTR